METDIVSCYAMQMKYCQTPGLGLRLGVDFVLPLSQGEEQQQEQEQEKEEPSPKSIRGGVLEG